MNAARRRAHGLLLVAAALAGVAHVAAAQDATPLLEPLGTVGPGATALESYLEERDRLIVERIQRQPPLAIGGGVALELAAIVAFEPAHLEDRMLGIRIRTTGTALTGSAAVTFLDLREVEELIRAIDLMDELIAAQPENTDAEVRHVSRDGFGVVAQRNAGVIGFAVRLHGAEDEDPLELAIGREPLTALRSQLDRCRLLLFQQ